MKVPCENSVAFLFTHSTNLCYTYDMKIFKRYKEVGDFYQLDWKDPTHWTEIKDFCKNELKATFNYQLKIWQVPKHSSMLVKLKENGWVSYEATQGEPVTATSLKTFPDHSSIKLNTKWVPDSIRAYQYEALQWLSVRNYKGIVALAPGLGKSLIAVVASALQFAEKPILVVCPVSLKSHWSRELRQWARMNSLILNSSFTWSKVRQHHEILIVNVDILHKIYSELVGKIGGIIVDEADTFSSSETKKWKAFHEIWKGTESCILLTGTPIRNRPVDLYNLLYLVDNEYWRDKSHYLQRYCNPTYGYGGQMEFKGATNLEELYARAKPFIFWKPMEEIAPDMPEQMITIYQIEVSDEEFAKANAEIEQLLEENGWSVEDLIDLDDPDAKQAEILLKIKELSRSAYFHKRGRILEHMKEFQNDTDESFVLVANHRAVMEDLGTQFNSRIINGGVPGHMRQKYVDEFNNGERRVLSLQTISGGTGFSLPKCKRMFIVEPDYSANRTEQVMGRIRRLTSESEVAFYQFFVVKGSIEEKMMKAISDKSKVATQTIHGQAKDLLGTAIWDILD